MKIGDIYVLRGPGAVRAEDGSGRSAEGDRRDFLDETGGVAGDGEREPTPCPPAASERGKDLRALEDGGDMPSPGPVSDEWAPASFSSPPVDDRADTRKQAGNGKSRDGEKRRVGLMAGYRLRHDGWTEGRQRLFLRALTETGCVRDACARAHISSTSAYRIRKGNPAFARAWTRALGKAMTTVEQAAYERAVIGWDEPIVAGGRIIGYRRKHSDALLRMLWLAGANGLRGGGSAGVPAEGATQEELVAAAEAASKAAGGFFITRARSEEVDATLKRHLDALAIRLKRKKEAQKARREAERAGKAD